jgi:antitoxin (DNA-binding transcriptional repressor) of toxin-antitoxin stability system
MSFLRRLNSCRKIQRPMSQVGRDRTHKAQKDPKSKSGCFGEALPVADIVPLPERALQQEASHASGKGGESAEVDQPKAVQAVSACDRVSTADDDKEQQNLKASPHCVVLGPAHLQLG